MQQLSKNKLISYGYLLALLLILALLKIIRPKVKIHPPD